MSTALAVPQQPKDPRLATVRGLLEKSKAQIALALPRHLTAERMMRVALTAIQTTPALLDCDPRSVIGSVVQASQLGLEIGVMGQAYLVPYKGKAQLIVGYRGLLSLARRSGELAAFEARIVHEGDVFKFAYGTAGGVHHEPALDKVGGRVVCAYACAKLRSGEWAYEVMTLGQLEAIRARSMAAQKGPWVTDTEEMYRKTVARRLLKWLPQSIELSSALEAEERQEVGLPPAADIELPEAPAASYAEHYPTLAKDLEDGGTEPAAASGPDPLAKQLKAQRQAQAAAAAPVQTVPVVSEAPTAREVGMDNDEPGSAFAQAVQAAGVPAPDPFTQAKKGARR